MSLSARVDCVALLFLACSSMPANASAAPSTIPGVVINHIASTEERYIGSPSVAILPNGDYIATHDEFGPKSDAYGLAVTRVFRSSDRGQSWQEIAVIKGAFWSTVFAHRGALYLIGTFSQSGNLVIRRSDDNGITWTTPKDSASGLLAEGKYHCAPVPVIEHNGRLWRAMEDLGGTGKWAAYFQAFMLSAPVDADLLKAESWTFSNRLSKDPAWLRGDFGGWLEGNAVVTPSGEIVDILRVDARQRKEKAAIIHLSSDGTLATFDPKRDFVDFPGGAKKFTIRWDATSQRYWTLSNFVPWRDAGLDPAKRRNTLALVSSRDLRHWDVRRIVLHHPDQLTHAFQYVDWLFDGDDIIAACRTAYDDGMDGAHNYHDANYLTFHRVRSFRTKE